MNSNDHTIKTTVKLLHEGNFGSETFAFLNEIMDQHKIGDLLLEMLEFVSRNGKTPENTVYEIMDTSQSVFELNKIMALLMMSRLYNFASGLYMHDVCDSIDIWIYSNHTPDLERQLLLNAPSNMDEGMKIHYEGWVEG